MNGDTLKVAKEKMITTYDTQIAALDITDPMAAVELVHNKEALVLTAMMIYCFPTYNNRYVNELLYKNILIR